jgi:hypothetical protein
MFLLVYVISCWGLSWGSHSRRPIFVDFLDFSGFFGIFVDFSGFL